MNFVTSGMSVASSRQPASSWGAPGRLENPSWPRRWIDSPVAIRRGEGAQMKRCRDPRCSPRGNPACRGTFGGRMKAVRSRFAIQGGRGGFAWDAVADKGLILRRRGNHVVFLELRRDSRVTTGISGFLLRSEERRGGKRKCWPEAESLAVLQWEAHALFWKLGALRWGKQFRTKWFPAVCVFFTPVRPYYLWISWWHVWGNAGSQWETFHSWQRSWGRRLGIHKGRIEPRESPRKFSSIYPQKTRVCLLDCFVLSPLTLLGAVPYHHLALSNS